MAQRLKSTGNAKFFFNHAIDPHFHPFQILFHAAHSLLHGLIDAVSCKCFLRYVTKYCQGPSYKGCICIPYQFWYKVIIITIITIITFSEVPHFTNLMVGTCEESRCGLRKNFNQQSKCQSTVARCNHDQMEHVFASYTTK